MNKKEKLFELNKSNILILTQALFEDKYVKTKDQHVKIYKDILRPYLEKGYNVVIKPHPRDTPIEVLNYNDEVFFEKVITIFSSSIDCIEFAKEKISLGFEFLKKYQ